MPIIHDDVHEEIEESSYSYIPSEDDDSED